MVGYAGTNSHAVIMKPGAVTHQADMGQRGIKLNKIRDDVIGKRVSFRMPPPGGLVAPPAHYMLFVLNGGLPCNKASWIQLVDPVAGTAARTYAPTAYADRYSTTMNTPVTITPVANDVDMDGSAIQWLGWATAPSQGTLRVGSTNTTWTYTPKAGVVGVVDTFTYRISDGTSTVTGVVTVTLGEMLWECRGISVHIWLMNA